MSIHTFIEIAESAYWRGHFERDRRKSNGNPGEFYNNLPEELKIS